MALLLTLREHAAARPAKEIRAAADPALCIIFEGMRYRDGLSSRVGVSGYDDGSANGVEVSDPASPREIMTYFIMMRGRRRRRAEIMIYFIMMK